MSTANVHLTSTARCSSTGFTLDAPGSYPSCSECNRAEAVVVPGAFFEQWMREHTESEEEYNAGMGLLEVGDVDRAYDDWAETLDEVPVFHCPCEDQE